MEKFIYVDNSATTKINSQVLVKMMPYLTDYYGNASTTYNLGKKSKEAIDESRRIIAHILKVNAKESAKSALKDKPIEVKKENIEISDEVEKTRED